MAMGAKKACAESGCPNLVEYGKGASCPEHRNARERQRTRDTDSAWRHQAHWKHVMVLVRQKNSWVDSGSGNLPSE